MNEYEVEIRATVTKTVRVFATNKADAIEVAEMNETINSLWTE